MIVGQGETFMLNQSVLAATAALAMCMAAAPACAQGAAPTADDLRYLAIIKSAQQDESAGNYDAAIAKLSQPIDHESLATGPLFGLRLSRATAYACAGRLAEAKADLNRILEQPDLSDGQRQTVQAALAGVAAAPTGGFRRAPPTPPDAEHARYVALVQSAHQDVSAGRFDAAIAKLSPPIEHDKLDVDALAAMLMARATAYGDAGRWAEAEADYNRILSQPKLNDRQRQAVQAALSVAQAAQGKASTAH
jgi:tetratricopeptide (TPR) repeat protein